MPLDLKHMTAPMSPAERVEHKREREAQQAQDDALREARELLARCRRQLNYWSRFGGHVAGGVDEEHKTHWLIQDLEKWLKRNEGA